MELRQLENITVKVLNQDRDKEVPRCEILQNSVSVGKHVPGAVFEAAIQWRELYLLFLTDDCPFEETLNIHLLDERSNVLDSATMFWIYSTGMFETLQLIQPNIVQFRFFGDTTWAVELLPKPAFRLPFITEPCGVWRRWGFSRRFKILESPRSG